MVSGASGRTTGGYTYADDGCDRKAMTLNEIDISIRYDENETRVRSSRLNTRIKILVKSIEVAV